MNFLQSVQIKLNIVSNYVQIREILNIELAMACEDYALPLKLIPPLNKNCGGGGVGGYEQ